MTTNNTILLYHAPQSRSSVALTLLEELGAPYELHVLNMKAGEQRQGAYLAINPLGKVPAILHRGELVTEQVAIFLYLADLFPAAALAPAINDRLRGPYLRWMAYYAACYEPALIDRAMKREPAPLALSPYGDFDTMLGTVLERLATSPYLLGETFGAVDLLWGMAFQWGMMFKLVPPKPVIENYVARVTARASFVKVAAMDAQWVIEHELAIKENKA
ncbi:glutathione S-transferase [Oxalobacteraceae bacterium GrIS 1.11]